MKTTNYILMFVVLVLLAGCLPCQHYRAEEEMPAIADALTKLSTKVEAVVRYGSPPENATSDELLTLATIRDPGLLTLFAPFQVKVLGEDRHALVLICSKDGNTGLLEDLGCSPRLDRNLWREQALMPCAFSLSVTLGCGGK